MAVARPEPARQAAAPKPAPPAAAPPARLGGATPATGSLAGPMAQLPPAGAVRIVGGAALTLSPAAQAALDAEGEVEVPAVFGALADGSLLLQKKGKSFGTKDSQSLRLNVPFLDRLRGAAVEPVLAVQVTDGVVAAKAALKVGGKLLDDPNEFLRPLRKHAAVLGWNGLDKLALDGLVNKVEGPTLTVGITKVGFGIGGFLTASGSLMLVNGAVDLNVTATGKVPGIGTITAPIRLTPEGLLVIQAKVDIAVKGFTGQLDVMYANGLLDVQGTVAYRNDRMDGSVTLVVTDKASAKALTDSHLPGQAPPVADGAAPVPPAAAPPELAVPQPKPGPRVVAGWGKVNVRLADWLTGEAMVVVDHLGDITIVGKMTPRMDKPLFAEKDYIHAFPKLEIRAVYGVPVVGNVFLFANIGVEAIAKIGPATLDRMEMTGTWSTKPEVLQNFGLTGTLNISAFAGIRVKAEGGAGITILDHDIKAGVALSALAGIRGYVDATPRIGYRELADPKAGKRGEFFIGGHLDIAAQPFLQLGGEMFVELDSPWWSPAPDKRWPWPLGTLEYPLPGEFGLGADIEHVIGSGKFPEIKFAPVNFDSQRFMTDLVSDHVPPKKSTGDKKKGTWKETPDGSAPAAGSAAPPPAGGKTPAKGKPVRPPEQQKRWDEGMKALHELSAAGTKDPKDKAEIETALGAIKKDKGFSVLNASVEGDFWVVEAAMSDKQKVAKVPKGASVSGASSATGKIPPKPRIPLGSFIYLELASPGQEFGIVDSLVMEKNIWYIHYAGRSGKLLRAVAQTDAGKAYWLPIVDQLPKGYFEGSAMQSPFATKAAAAPLVATAYHEPKVSPQGWDRLADKANWVRAHLINGSWAGPGRPWNLVPTPIAVNNSMKDAYELDLHAAIAANKPIWFEAKVKYYDDKDSAEIKRASDFARLIIVKYGRWSPKNPRGKVEDEKPFPVRLPTKKELLG